MSDKTSWTPVVLRVGICLVYLWFGTNLLFHAALWTSFLPDYSSLLPISPEHIVQINGLSEIILAIFLLIGWKVRFFATLLAIHAFHIMVTVGYNAIGVRDFGIFTAVLSIALHGKDRCCLDSRPAVAEISI